MLSRLHVSNYAIIDEVEINFSSHLTTITGETGAGKSILLGALSLILGERSESTSFFDRDKKCVIEGYFDIKGLKLNDFFSENELDYDEHTIIRREITPGGKSRAFINDTPVTLQILKELSSQLVSLHSQMETLELNDSAFQLTLIDAVAQHEELLEQYKTSFRQFKQNEKQLTELKQQHDNAMREQDYLQFQFNELSEAGLKEGEQEETEQELNYQNNAEEIKKNISASLAVLSASSDNYSSSSILNNLKETIQLLQSVQKYQPALEDLIKRIESTRIELQDVADELERTASATSFEPEKITALTERLDLIYRLEKKHRVNTVAELLQLQQSFDEQLQSFQSQEEELEKLSSAVSKQRTELVSLANKLSKNRLAQLPKIEKQVNALLGDAGMPFARIKIQHEKFNDDELVETGIDRFRILFASNKGSEFIELKKVASGGELSRLMLCIKSLIASSAALPTLIFDEIDTGISGETAVKVSRILKNLSAAHQVICITHLPQIAGKGDAHYYVFKENTSRRTFTRVKSLTQDERIFEIAKMLSGEKPTAAALKNAKELIEMN